MASNKELQAQVGVLRAKLGDVDLGVEPEKMNNAQLTELVAKLEADVAALPPPGGPGPSVDQVRPIDGNTGDLAKDAKPEAPAAPKREYSVGRRASIMAAGRILVEGDEVVPERDVPNPDDLKNLIASGAIVKAEPAPTAS